MEGVNTMRSEMRTAAVRAAVLLTVACLTAMGQVTFRGLGVPNIILADMSADGSVAVGLPISVSGESSGIRWTAAGGAEDIGGAMSNIAISRDGKTIVGATREGRTGPRTAAIWQGGTSWKLLGGLPGGVPDSENPPDIASLSRKLSMSGISGLFASIRRMEGKCMACSRRAPVLVFIGEAARRIAI